MSAPSPVDGVRQLVEPLVEAVGLVLEDVTVTPAGKRRVLRITVDLPETETGGVPMDAVTDAAQAISAALDSDVSMGSTPYVLEVSSPGADRPLTRRRHWLRARGRLVRLSPADGVKTSAPQWSGDAPAGRLVEVDDDGVELEGGRRYPWGEIRAGKVELDFSRPVDDVGDDEPDDELDDEEEDVTEEQEG